jgi:hypothetical protein
MALALDLRGIDPTALAAWLDLPPAVEGPADLYAEATAAGGSPRALVGSLIGELRIALPDGRLVGGERLAALRAGESVDGAGRGGASRAESRLAGGPGASANGAGAAVAIENLSGRFALKRGIATTDGVSFELDSTTARLAGTIDLLLWVADLKLKVRTLEGASNDVAGLQLVGPLDRPQIRLLMPAPATPQLNP